MRGEEAVASLLIGWLIMLVIFAFISQTQYNDTWKQATCVQAGGEIIGEVCLNNDKVVQTVPRP